MQRKFQQSKVFLFIDRLVVSVVSETGTHSAFSKTVKTPLVQFLDGLLTPVVPRQVQMAQTVQKIVELPQVQLLRCLVDVSVLMQRQVPGFPGRFDRGVSCHRSWRKS